MTTAKKNSWRESWDEFRCIVAETLLSWALLLYPSSSPLKLRLALFLQDELKRELQNKIT
jgi:hypothetical protein